MKQQAQKDIRQEVNILDRIMMMLEEGSVTHMVQQDAKFGKFVEQLYGTVYSKAEQLQRI